jgi:hypothetical protein
MRYVNTLSLKNEMKEFFAFGFVKSAKKVNLKKEE